MAVIIGGSNNTILSTTWANKPASYPVGQSVFITNAGAKGSHWFYDGTRWKPLNGTANLASVDAVSSSIGNTYTNVMQYLIPAEMWQTYDRIRVFMSTAKTGTTDQCSLIIRVGTAGTGSDTQVYSNNMASAGNRQASAIYDIRLESATSVLTTTAGALGYGASTGNALPAATTISSASANALYVTVFIRSSGTTDTVQLSDGDIQLISTAN